MKNTWGFLMMCLYSRRDGCSYEVLWAVSHLCPLAVLSSFLQSHPCLNFVTHFLWRPGFVTLIVSMLSTSIYFQAVVINMFSFLLQLERKRNRTKIKKVNTLAYSCCNLVWSQCLCKTYCCPFKSTACIKVLKWQVDNYIYHFRWGRMTPVSVKESAVLIIFYQFNAISHTSSWAYSHLLKNDWK